MVVVTFTVLIVSCSFAMELPFGSDSLDMPGLSFCNAAAETSLRMVTPNVTAEDGHILQSREHIKHLMEVDEDEVFSQPADAAPSAGGGGGSTPCPAPPRDDERLEKDGAAGVADEVDDDDDEDA